MDFLIGSITCLILFWLFRFLEKKRVPSLGKAVVPFGLVVLLVAYLFKPSEEIFLWLGMMCLFYSVLDDLLTKTLHIYVPILATLLFLLFIEKPYFFIFSFIFFLLALLFTKITREKIMGEGDIYVFLPLSFLLIDNLSNYSVLSVSMVWVEAWLMSILLAFVIFLPQKIWKTDMQEFAFTPFLVLGCVFVYAQWEYTPWVFLGLCVLSFSWIIIYSVVTAIRLITKKK